MTATGLVIGSKINENSQIRETLSKAVKNSAEKVTESKAVQIARDSASSISSVAKAVAGKATSAISFGVEAFFSDPKVIVDNIRSSKGPGRDEALLGFKNKIDKMDTHELKEMRNYLVELMSSNTNNDDELLGAMAKMVNRELDSRGSNIIDVIGRPIPFPGGCFPPPIRHPLPDIDLTNIIAQKLN